MTADSEAAANVEAIRARYEAAHAAPTLAAKHRAFRDSADDIPNLFDALATVTTERDRARRCLFEHVECDEPECAAEIVAALGVGPDPIEAELTEARAQLATAHNNGYDQAVERLRDGERYSAWVAAQPFDVDLANDEPSRHQLADYLEQTKDQA